jgi:tRNA A37 threonylcarbamoyladenosine dehydratase
MERLSRLELLLGKEKLKRLHDASVTVVGLGAVGSYAVEALARAGVGRLRLVDFDRIRPSNMNRHIWAFGSTVGRPKAEVAKERISDINPSCKAEALEIFAAADTVSRILDNKPDLVIDAIDSLNPKTQVLKACYEKGLKVISSMGAATRLDPFSVKAGDLFDTKTCPLARHLRSRLKREGVGRGILCVYSDEPRNIAAVDAENLYEEEYDRGRKRRRLGSMPTVTGIFGLVAAHCAIAILCGGLRK